MGLGERLALLKARKGLMGAVHADVMFIKADGSTVSIQLRPRFGHGRFGHVRHAEAR